jgi:hypothetical protein
MVCLSEGCYVAQKAGVSRVLALQGKAIACNLALQVLREFVGRRSKAAVKWGLAVICSDILQCGVEALGRAFQESERRCSP